ncbi:metal-dependent protease of the PAD1/JAB1 superfamily [Methanosarcinales archaeon ex4572_44]|nr:MAG: metal-dependent protease of the PAD1/JAB1 superfamily [Methanosarcinales archaeon ex4484_138]PHP45886.1 MAG: metal-dependent protease of the PAD1/JAB1 superfamily [Methanosarcinales archaeon ex4572_44]RLG27266.1 MAG: metal-dependent protease of the PAD1/JAB1 superfamily [Methanosarcinales archaeon]RLG27342.1 MAG: metal-dependent protease of the PAD1/JAB1 superfamily [Methanosarcinales archaeon]
MIKNIKRDTLSFILEVSKSTAPREFAGLLRAEKETIVEVLFLPGTTSSEVSAVLHLYMLPNMRIAGTVHSHPTPNTNPSHADLQLFARTGNCHIIVGAPYTTNSWTCYNTDGTPRELKIT